jgi:hypothetical protein
MASDLSGATAAAEPEIGQLPPDWIVAVSADESARGRLHPQSQNAALAAFHAHGCLLLSGVFPASLIDAMHQEYLARYGGLDARAMMEEAMRPQPNPIAPRGEARFEITLRMSGAFARPDVFANPLLRGVLSPLLGADMQLNSFSTVVSYPGSTVQQVHRDHGHLFASEPGLGPTLPVHAINVGVPLIDVDLETGPTGVWPGSHRWPASTPPEPETVTAIPLRRGDCLLLDYRTFHTGLANRGQRLRPVLYMVYARGWFSDEATHFGVNSPDLSLEDYRKLPESTHILLYRALSQAMRSERGDGDRPRHHASARNSADPSTWGKVGRNDPCPCGSGRKYKQCHGRGG